VQTTPGNIVNLTAVVRAEPHVQRRTYYPAIYWFSMLRVPDKANSPGTGPKGNGIPENMKSQGQWFALC